MGVVRVTVNHIIFVSSKFVDFKRMTYWSSLILAVSQFNALLNVFSIFKGTTFKGKNIGSIFFPLIVALFKTWFPLR